MASIMNLEDLPQLVMEKITSPLDHKQLLALEQVSRALKCAVDAHFSTTNHLIIGSLPKIDDGKDKKHIDGLLKIINRCGIRLRTIQITLTYDITKALGYDIKHSDIYNYYVYFDHVFESAEVSNSCPNIENIIASPVDIDIIKVLYSDVFFQQNVLLDTFQVDDYANNIKLSTGEACKLRSIRLSSDPWQARDLENSHQPIEQILNLYSNIEQISVYNPGENFFKSLHQFMENGLKDLEISDIGGANIRIATKYCNIWKDLRALRLVVTVEKDDDIAALNKLKLPKNAKLTVKFSYHCKARLNEKICSSVSHCIEYRRPAGSYRLLSEFKNMETFKIKSWVNWKVITEGSFPKLRRINISWVCTRCDINTCNLKRYLPQLLINYGNQFTYIDIKVLCQKSLHLVWKALRHCRSAKVVRIKWMEYLPLTITYKDVEAICHLPNLQRFMFGIPKIERADDTSGLVRELMERAVKGFTDFQFEYTFRANFFDHEHQYLLYRVNF